LTFSFIVFLYFSKSDAEPLCGGIEAYYTAEYPQVNTIRQHRSGIEKHPFYNRFKQEF